MTCALVNELFKHFYDIKSIQCEGTVTANKLDFYECLSAYSDKNKNMRKMSMEKVGGQPKTTSCLMCTERASA